MLEWKGTQTAPSLNPGPASYTLSSLSPIYKVGITTPNLEDSEEQNTQCESRARPEAGWPRPRALSAGSPGELASSHAGAPLGNLRSWGGNSWKLGFYPFRFSKPCRKVPRDDSSPTDV